MPKRNVYQIIKKTKTTKGNIEKPQKIISKKVIEKIGITKPSNPLSKLKSSLDPSNYAKQFTKQLIKNALKGINLDKAQIKQIKLNLNKINKNKIETRVLKLINKLKLPNSNANVKKVKSLLKKSNIYHDKYTNLVNKLSDIRFGGSKVSVKKIKLIIEKQEQNRTIRKLQALRSKQKRELYQAYREANDISRFKLNMGRLHEKKIVIEKKSRRDILKMTFEERVAYETALNTASTLQYENILGFIVSQLIAKQTDFNKNAWEAYKNGLINEPNEYLKESA